MNGRRSVVQYIAAILGATLLVAALAFLYTRFTTESREAGDARQEAEITPEVSGEAETLSPEDVRRETAKTDQLNNTLSDSEQFGFREIVGRDQRNGWLIVRQGKCSDVCPENSVIVMIYEGISEDECEQGGGEKIVDPAWNAYRGCAPKITP